VTEQQKELERLGAKIKPAVRSWVDNVIVPALVEEWLAQEGSANRLAVTPQGVAQFESSELLSAEGVA
jgi:hypothetical protein